MAFGDKQRRIAALESKVERTAAEREAIRMQRDKAIDDKFKATFAGNARVKRLEGLLEDLAKLHPEVKGLRKVAIPTEPGFYPQVFPEVDYDFAGVNNAANFAQHKANHKAYSAVSN